MKIRRCVGVVLVGGVFSVSGSSAATRYVDVSNATPAAPFTNWSMAATGIQPAIDAAANGDEILVAPGTYLLGGSAVRMPIEKTLALRSTRSRAAIIDAQGLSAGLFVYGTNCLAEGFTVRNGDNDGYGGGIVVARGSTVRDCLVVGNRSDAGGGGIEIYEYATVEGCTIQSNVASHAGGGIVLYNGTTGVVRNCRIADNVATGDYANGGGVYVQFGGMVSNCWIANNRVTATNGEGGGVYMNTQGTGRTGTLVNSVVHGNWAGNRGGGVYSVGPIGTLQPVINCTIVSNAAGADGGGVYAYTTRFINDIVYFNSAPTNANLNAHDSEHSCLVSNCCTTSNYFGGSITNAPAFVDAGAGDFRLATASFGIDAGTTNGAPGTDIDGNPRPRQGKAGMLSTNGDMGAYEYAFHFNEIRTTAANEIQFKWDVEDRGIYRLQAATNAAADPANPFWENVLAYTNAGMPAGQFLVHTQAVSHPVAMPGHVLFRLQVSHTPF
ncbi:MAG: choice-of-anchor Q domain-containing protein [Kiritimatiellia bacterium]